MADNTPEDQRKPSWFEFLLDEDLLEQHLKNENAGKKIYSGVVVLFSHRNRVFGHSHSQHSMCKSTWCEFLYSKN